MFRLPPLSAADAGTKLGAFRLTLCTFGAAIFIPPVTDRRLGDLGDERLGVAQQGLLEGPAAREFLPQDPRFHLQGAAGDLDDGPVGRGVAAQEQRDPDHAIVAGEPHFRGHPTGQGGEQRDHRGGGKVHEGQAAAGFVDDVA